MKKIWMIPALLMTASSAYAAPAATTNDYAAVDTACASDLATANCQNAPAGRGKLACLHAYIGAHPKDKFSDSCKGALAGHRTGANEYQDIDAACAGDIATASCQNAPAGRGKLACLHKYMGAHPTDKFSAECRGAMDAHRGQ